MADKYEFLRTYELRMKVWQIIIIIILVVFLFFGALLTQAKKLKKKEVTDKIKYLFPAKYGDQGEHIKNTQKWLNTQLSPPMAQLIPDGIWGPKTETAVYFVTNKNTVSYNEYLTMIS